MVGGRDECGGDGGELVANVAEIAGVWGLRKEFVDDRSDVVQSRDRREGWGVCGAKGPTSDGKDQGGLNDLDGDAAVVELTGELAVAAARVACDTGSQAIEIEDPLDIESTREWRHDQALADASADLVFGRGW